MSGKTEAELTHLELDHLRKWLTERTAELKNAIADTQKDRAPVMLDQQSVGRLSRMDAMQVQAMAEAQKRQRLAEINAIDAALSRMDDDEYGYCIICGEQIVHARLALNPAIATCLECARAQEQ